MGDKDNIETVFKFKRDNPEQFHCLVKMHLSFMLDMNTDECDCSFLYEHLQPTDHGTPKRKGTLLNNKGAGLTCNKKGIMEGVPLTMEGVCQIFQLIQFLDRGTNIEQVGLFRKTGNLQKQKVSSTLRKIGDINPALTANSFSRPKMLSSLNRFGKVLSTF